MAKLRVCLFAFSMCLVTALVGCGPAHYQPTGKITKGGTPFTVSEKGVVQIALYAESDAKLESPFPATWEKDGTFRVVGISGQGVPAGKYRVSVKIFDPYTGPDSTDILGGAMYGEKGQVVEVKSGSEIVVDIAKK